jgi:ribosomal-protein-alanine N-acetyltransferase
LRSAFIGYYAFAGFDRKGLMKEALGLVLRHAFNRLKLHRLEANIQPQNRASIALARSCGFTREGYSRRYLKVAGHWRDHERWAILAEDAVAAFRRKRFRTDRLKTKS